jgi:hypothetical protein
MAGADENKVEIMCLWSKGMGLEIVTRDLSYGYCANGVMGR